MTNSDQSSGHFCLGMDVRTDQRYVLVVTVPFRYPVPSVLLRSNSEITKKNIHSVVHMVLRVVR